MSEKVIEEVVDSIDAMEDKGRYSTSAKAIIKQVRTHLEKGNIHRACDKAWELQEAVQTDFYTLEDFYNAVYEVKIDPIQEILPFVEANVSSKTEVAEFRNARDSYMNGKVSGKYRLAVLKERIENDTARNTSTGEVG